MTVTMLDIAKLNLGDDEVGLIDEAFKLCPEISGFNPLTGQQVPNVGDAKTIAGLNYSTLIRTSVPTGSSFRSANNGVDPVKSGYENRMVSTYIFDKRFQVDKAVADRYEDGAAAYLALEASGVMEGGVQDLASQFYYGTDVNSLGFPGLMQAVHADMVVDATGSTASTGSSVWFVKFGPKDVRHVVGVGGEFAMSEPRIETITGANSKQLDGYVQTLLFYPGLQVGHRYACLRIKDLTEDSGKGLTDDLLGQALSTFMDKRKMRPDAAFLTHRSLRQLRESRTATNVTGAPAPTPTEYEGIPLIPTDGLTNTETLT